MSPVRVEKLRASYGSSQVTSGVDLSISEVEVNAIMGRTGMG